MAGRFNKILEFIGLVDDEPEEDMDQNAGRAQSYGAQGKRTPPPPPRSRAYEEPKPQPRYTSSARPDYDARQRRNDYQPTADRYAGGGASRYGQPQQPAADRYGSTSGYRARPDAGAGYRPQTPPPQREYRAADREFDAFAAKPAPSEPRANVVPIPARAPSQQTVIYYLRTLEECRDVINDLIDNKTVLLNLEDMDERTVQRGIDTLCGAAFALNATLRKASDKTYLIAPNTVQVASTRDEERRY